MHLLLCNDDGVNARGIRTLARNLADAGHRVTIVAPSEERSGQSHAMTFFRPVMVQKLSEGVYAVHGTPADCAAIALIDILKNDKPDMVISGINHGPNVGSDVNYSGTVGAATEAAFLGYKAIAVSTDLAQFNGEAEERYAFEAAAHFVCEFLTQIDSIVWPNLEVLNINHPGVPHQGVRVASCGTLNLYNQNIDKLTCGKEYKKETSIYLLGGNSRRSHDASNEDVHLLQAGYVTLSFLQCRQNSTQHNAALESVAQKFS